MMDDEDIQQWKYNPVTKSFFGYLLKQRNIHNQALTDELNHSAPNILLHIGKLVGTINVLDDILNADLVENLIENKEKE